MRRCEVCREPASHVCGGDTSARAYFCGPHADAHGRAKVCLGTLVALPRPPGPVVAAAGQLNFFELRAPEARPQP